MTKKIFIMLCILFLAKIGFCQSVSDVDLNGSEYTITGTSFGTHVDYNTGEDYLCLTWDDFEDNNLSDQFNGNGAVTITTSNNRVNSTYNVLRDVTENNWGIGIQNSTVNEYYTSFWGLVPSGTVFGGDGQIKWVRIWHEPDAGSPNITFGKKEFTSDKRHATTVEEAETGSNNDLYNTLWSDGEWHHIRMYFKPSTTLGGSDGIRKIWVDDNLLFDETDVVTTDNGANTFNGRWSVMRTIISCDTDIQADDVYFSHTRARVELGNNATYASCNHIETQIPTAWSTTEITVDVNMGSFTSADDIWLFVIDEDGVASDGYQVQTATTDPVISGTSGTANDGEPFTLNGLNFGTHTDNDKYDGEAKDQSGLMHVWDNFDSDSYLQEDGDFDGVDYEHWVQTLFDASTDMPLTDDSGRNRTGSRLCFPVPTWENAGGVRISTSSSNDGYYTYFWQMIPSGMEYSSTAQLKMVRIYDSTYPNITYKKHEFDGDRNHSVTLETSSSSTTLNTYDGNHTLWDDGEWHLVEVWFKPETSASANDGLSRMWIDGVLVSDDSNIDTVVTAYNGQWWVDGFIRGFTNPTDANEEAYVDDVYFNYTQARVMIGNNAVFANCTHREIFIPTSWSDTSITGTFNQGSFESGDTVYAFVIDEDGTASDGYTLTIGSESDDPVDDPVDPDGVYTPSTTSYIKGSGQINCSVTRGQ